MYLEDMLMSRFLSVQTTSYKQFSHFVLDDVSFIHPRVRKNLNNTAVPCSDLDVMFHFVVTP